MLADDNDNVSKFWDLEAVGVKFDNEDSSMKMKNEVKNVTMKGS